MSEHPKYCTKCKENGIDTLLEVGINVTQKRLDNSHYICNDCYRLMQQKYKQEKWSEYNFHKEKDMIKKFTEQWNDPEFAMTGKSKMKLYEKTVKVFNKYEIRVPAEGYTKEVMCMVMFPDLWFIEADVIINDMLAKKDLTMSHRLNDKQVLLQYIPENINLYTETYRNKALAEFQSIINMIAVHYVNQEKLVATTHEDHYSHLKEKRYHLLSYERELEIRNILRQKIKNGLDISKLREQLIIDLHKQHEIDVTQKHINEDNKEGTKE
jgi:hypothetical protein